MKKLPLLIAILLILAGLCGRATEVHASPANPNEDCTYDNSVTTVPNNEPCKNPIFIPGTNIPVSQTNSPYHLLQPLPCQEGSQDCNKGMLTDINTGSENALITYLNFAIRLIIGLCIVLAVVTTVVGGMEYATSELISGKAEGKDRILRSIFGLVLALGSYTLLFQINPDLLNGDVEIEGVNLAVLQQEFEIVPDIIPSDSGPLPSGRVAACGGAIVKTRSGMYSCGDIAQNVDNMIDAAKQAGLNISGGGFRTREQQIAKRIANCNGNTTDASYPCRPPTAVPGHSRHESGLAFDLSCGGRTIKSRSSPCFVWLQNNASRYGLYNLPSEPWHWSVDGK
jgi:hypothetical protein